MEGENGNIQEKQLILLSTSLEEFRQQSFLTDVTLICGTEKFQASKVVLAASSKYFLKLFTNPENRDTVTLEQSYSPKVMNILLSFACTGFISVSENDSKLLQELLQASEQLKFDLVTEYCYRLMADVLNEENFCQHWALAKKFNNEEMKIQVCKFLALRFEKIQTSEEFSNIPLECLKMVICQPELKTEDADLVFKALLNWVKFDSQTRLKSLRELLPVIDFTSLSDELLDELANDEDSLVNEDMFLMKKVLTENNMRLKNLRRQSCCTTPVSVVGNGELSFLKASASMDLRQLEKKTNSIKSNEKDLKRGVEKNFSNIEENFQSSLKISSPVESRNTNSHFIPPRQSAFQPIQPAKPELVMPVITETPKVKHPLADTHRMVLMLKVLEDKTLVQRYSLNEKRWSGLCEVELGEQLPQNAAFCQNKNKLYLIGGRDDAWVMKSTVFCLDLDTNEWKKLENMTTARTYAGATVMDDEIYVVGGIGQPSQRLNLVERYSIANRKWETLKPLNSCRERPAVTSCLNKIYVIGGYTVSPEQWRKREVENEQSASMEIYDPTVKQWTKITTKLPIGREVGHKVYASTTFGEKIYALRVMGADEVVSLFQYSPDLNYWKEMKIYYGKVSPLLMIAPVSNNILCLIDLAGNVYLYEVGGEMQKIAEEPEIGSRISYCTAYNFA